MPNGEYVAPLQKKYGEARGASIPKDTYKGLDADVPVVGVPNYLVVSEEMDDKLASTSPRCSSGR